MWLTNDNKRSLLKFKFTPKALIADTIFSSPTGDEIVILRDQVIHAKV